MEAKHLCLFNLKYYSKIIINNLKLRIMKMKNTLSSSNAASVDIKEIPNTVLQRLIKEVHYDKKNNITAYDRVHNRHNR